MKVIVFIGVCLSVAQALPRSENATEWEEYKEINKKSYKGKEDLRRMTIYLYNKAEVERHNKKYQNGEVSFKIELNQFADMLASEVKGIMNGYTGDLWQTGIPYEHDESEEVADSIDWRDQGVVTPVKNQGHCGSCWSFSVTGSLEGQNALYYGELVSLSEQNLVDCSMNNNGCHGGNMDRAFDYIMENGGIDTEDSYPYTGEEGYCEFSEYDVGARVTGHVDIPHGDENALMNAVHNVGPISIAIDASQSSFHKYSEGVYDEPNCSSTQLDHGVLIVGYGTENGTDYWLVKNSWGERWGEQGYIKIARNNSNQCGIASKASYPLVY